MTRRSVLRMTTAVAGLTLAPARAIAEGAGPSPAMAALSAYMSEAGSRALPGEVAERAKHHLIDTLAAMISGSQLPPGQAAARHVTAHGGKGGATVAGTTLVAAPLDAALANGVMAHADETDDSHGPSRSHPGCAIVPAALARRAFAAGSQRDRWRYAGGLAITHQAIFNSAHTMYCRKVRKFSSQIQIAQESEICSAFQRLIRSVPQKSPKPKVTSRLCRIDNTNAFL